MNYLIKLSHSFNEIYLNFFKFLTFRQWIEVLQLSSLSSLTRFFFDKHFNVLLLNCYCRPVDFFVNEFMVNFKLLSSQYAEIWRIIRYCSKTINFRIFKLISLVTSNVENRIAIVPSLFDDSFTT